MSVAAKIPTIMNVFWTALGLQWIRSALQGCRNLTFLRSKSKYDFNIRLLVSLANKGMIQLSTDNVDEKVSIDLKIETKNNKTEIYASKVNTKFNIKTFKANFDDSQQDLVQLNEVLRQTVTANQQEILNVMVPKIEKKISELIMSIMNKIIYNRKEQLFPD
ncbi:PREDICTED: uncharacterized protein LOC105462847 [Wasmannia auropunctata]|uniref:uncharacterized protein LOC105462847 n=1 Tax=Wasmannia auropunctata TaxID=64793 RepID=UPI0005EF1C59|nr:PREDICTED: uncharacterized protein LOC105462847 [Wasmannia auropunctata]